AGRAFLLVEVGGASQDEARERAERVIANARQLRECTGAAYLADPREQAAVWQIRESGLGSSAFIPGRPRSWPGAEDSAVPPVRLGEFLRGFDRILSSRNLKVATYYGHFGEGCVHARVNFDLTNAPGIATFRAAMIQLGELVASLGGSLSGEHGDGLARSELLPMMFRPELIDAFRDFKRIFDPDSMMNPGVIVNPHPLDSHLKLGTNYRPREIATHFNFKAEGGLAGAALKCVGIGKCRKTEAGTMCPSYMATRDEVHSTRGRARILFEALTTDLLPEGFADPAVKDALDLCLSCKGCKAECPSSVDMAAYRAEFFSNYYRNHRRPLSSAFFGRLNEVARLASYAPSLANALAHAPVLEDFAKKTLAIHSERELPRFARRTFRSWFERRTAPRARTREVVMFPDTFNNFFEPHVAIAAVEVLERAGFRVIIPRAELCCGRPLYDQGMLERAKARLTDVMDVLDPFVAVGIPIVGLEPSCILTFRDELPSLFSEDPRAKAIASSAFLLDEFLVREAPDFAPPALRRRTIVQGHCHQKAIAGIGDEVTLLSRAAGAQLEVLDAGCCGMAGAFGYDREHFEVSKAIGARVLIPAIEKAAPDAIIVADGFSCRSQIRHFCPSRRPMHLAEVLNLAPGGR
ncbi:MAG: FAD-linked oxidase C-terminal domain-containing protein, partial [Candidatus Binatus sp.]